MKPVSVLTKSFALWLSLAMALPSPAAASASRSHALRTQAGLESKTEARLEKELVPQQVSSAGLEDGMGALLWAVLGVTVGYGLTRAWRRWRNPPLPPEVQRLLELKEKYSPGTADRFRKTRDVMPKHVFLLRDKKTGPNARRIALSAMDWFAFWMEMYAGGGLLDERMRAGLFVKNSSELDLSDGRYSGINPDGGPVMIEVTTSAKHAQKARIDLMEVEARLRDLGDEDQSPERAYLLGSRERILREMDPDVFMRSILSTESFHAVEQWVRLALGLPVGLWKEFSREQQSSEAFRKHQIASIQTEAGDHLSNVLTGNWIPSIVRLLAYEDQELHSPATIVSWAALQKIDQWIAADPRWEGFRLRWTMRMIQANTLADLSEPPYWKPGS